MFDFLNGYKTYLLVAVGVGLLGGEAMGIVPQGTVDKLDALLALLGLATLRSAIRKA